jgi:hypothetical protein
MGACWARVIALKTFQGSRRMLDVFNQDAFNVVSMTTAINKLPVKPARLGKMGLFRKRGITTTTAVIEEKRGKLYLIPTQARGTMQKVASGKSRRIRTFAVPHLPLNDEVMADDVQGVRSFGSEDKVEGVTQVVNEKLQTLRNSHEATHEYHRCGAVQGTILDADGSSVIYDLFSEFSLTRDQVEFDFDTDSTDVKQLSLQIIRLIKLALGGTPFSKIHAMCGDAFFDAFIGHASVKAAFDRYQDNQFAREQQTGEGGFAFAGIIWENYTGKIGSVDFFDDEIASFFPVGAPDLFEQIMSPANFIETVNTVGKEIYAKQKKMDWDVGVEIHTQSNPLIYCNRPKCLVEGIMGAGSSTSSASGASTSASG